MFVLIRALVYASTFVGLVLIYVPSLLQSWLGIARPAETEAVQIAGLIVGSAGAAVVLWCLPLARTIHESAAAAA